MEIVTEIDIELDINADLEYLDEEEIIEVNCECGVIIITAFEQQEDDFIICPKCEKEHQLFKLQRL